jgi:hypothetical protein
MEFLEGCKDSKMARRRAPWAVRVAKVEGGYMAFRTEEAYRTWRAQR